MKKTVNLGIKEEQKYTVEQTKKITLKTESTTRNFQKTYIFNLVNNQLFTFSLKHNILVVEEYLFCVLNTDVIDIIFAELIWQYNPWRPKFDAPLQKCQNHSFKHTNIYIVSMNNKK